MKAERSHWRCSIEKVFLRISQIHRKTPVLKFLYKKVKDSLQHKCFPVNFATKFKNTAFTEPLWTTASEKLCI